MTHIIGTDINKVDASSAINYLIRVAKALTSTADLDADTQAKDCLANFEEYNWIKSEGANPELFDELLNAGLEGEMSKNQLFEFMSLIDPVNGETHVYYWICVANCLPDSVGGVA